MVAFFISLMDFVVTDTVFRVVRDITFVAAFGSTFASVFGSAFGALFGSAFGAIFEAVFEAVFGAVFGAVLGAVFETAIEPPFGAAFVVPVLLATLRDETDFDITSFSLVEAVSVFFGAARPRFAGAFSASMAAESVAVDAAGTTFARARVVTGMAVRVNQRCMGAKCSVIGVNSENGSYSIGVVA
jgi:hypothetical protein